MLMFRTGLNTGHIGYELADFGYYRLIPGILAGTKKKKKTFLFLFFFFLKFLNFYKGRMVIYLH